MAPVRQAVTIVLLADRHADLHDRDFAEARTIPVESGTLAEVLTRTAAVIDLPCGRYTLNVGEPYDE